MNDNRMKMQYRVLMMSIHEQLNTTIMKKRMLLAAGAVLVAASVSAFVYVKNESSSMDGLFNANVEALADGEVITDVYMHIWWVNTQSGGRICTYGGYSPCYI